MGPKNKRRIIKADLSDSFKSTGKTERFFFFEIRAPASSDIYIFSEGVDIYI